MTKNDIIQTLEAIIERDRADGCCGCAFEDVQEWEMPCRDCKRSKKDYWRADALDCLQKGL